MPCTPAATRAEGGDRLAMRLARLETIGVIRSESRGEHGARQACETDVLIDAHGILVLGERAEPHHGHEVALRRKCDGMCTAFPAGRRTDN
eukprot:7390552-Prymnesium_polylepis.1